jgi:hypothetical protein
MGATRTLRFECEPGETAFIPSACSVVPDAGVVESSVVTCGNGMLEPTDECEGMVGCGTGSCVNCSCIDTCPAPPNPNPELLCMSQRDCPEFNGQCFACRCSESPATTLADPTGDAPSDADIARVSLLVSSDALLVDLRFGAGLRPYLGDRVCIVEYSGAGLVAEICYFVDENVKAELKTRAGSRLLTTDEYGARFNEGVSAKRSVLPLASGNSIFIYSRTAGSTSISDRVPDRGGVSVDRLLGTL